MDSQNPTRAERLAQRRAEGRRRARPRREFDTTIPSPCIQVCQIDNETGCCIGCFRSIDEVREWPIMTAEDKLKALDRIAERKAKRAT